MCRQRERGAEAGAAGGHQLCAGGDREAAQRAQLHNEAVTGTNCHNNIQVSFLLISVNLKLSFLQFQQCFGKL